MNILINRGAQYELSNLPKFSIALDGAVPGPEIDTENNRYSFDHHHGCLRFCTTATCTQAWTAILGGLDPAKYTIYINDVDIDIVAALWCFKNSERCKEPIVKKLIDAIGIGDMHLGAIPLNGMHKVVEWVSAPQTDSIRNGDYQKLSNDGLVAIMESMLHRITMYVDGEAANDIAERDVESDFDIKRKENGWVLVESADPHVYSSLWRSGFDRVVLLRPQDDGSSAVMIAKRTDFIENYPIAKMTEELNKLEPGWGGGTNIIGAPRHEDGSRSKLPLDSILEVVNACIEGREPIIKKPPIKKKMTKKKVVKKALKK